MHILSIRLFLLVVVVVGFLHALHEIFNALKAFRFYEPKHNACDYIAMETPAQSSL